MFTSSILVGSYNSNVQVWNTSRQCLAKLNGHNGAVKAVCWISAEQITTKKKNTSKVLKFISASQDQSVIIWEWNQATNAVVKTEKCVGHTESVECLDVNQDKTKVKSKK